MTSYIRAGITVRYFTPSEDVELERRRIAGESLREISNAMSRGKSSIQMRLLSLAMHDEDDQS